MYCKLAISLLFATLLGSTLGAYVDTNYDTDAAKVITNLLGLNCLSDAILNLEDSAGDFQYNAQKCGNKTLDNVANVLDDIADVTIITDKILNINDKDCNNAGYKESEDATKAPPAICGTNMTRQLTKLNTSIKATLADITTLQTTDDSCAKVAVINLQLSLEGIPTILGVCGTLASSKPSS